MGHLFSEWFTHTFPNMEWLLDLVLGIILFFFGPLPLFRKYKFFITAIKVKGIILHQYIGDRESETYANIRYEFNGKMYKRSICWIPSIIGKDEGKYIKVYIDPNDTNHVCVKQFRANFTEWVCTIFFVIELLCFVMMLVH